MPPLFLSVKIKHPKPSGMQLLVIYVIRKVNLTMSLQPPGSEPRPHPFSSLPLQICEKLGIVTDTKLRLEDADFTMVFRENIL